MSGGQIDTVMLEKRVFPPPAQFARKARLGSLQAYEELYQRAAADPEKFWGDLAREELHWFKPFNKVLEWQEPFAKWFVGGRSEERRVGKGCRSRWAPGRSIKHA